MSTSLKTCFKCGVSKPLEDYYRHPQMGDGHLNKCKDCTKQDAHTHRYDPKFREKLLAYDRDRFHAPDRKSASYASAAEHRKNNPEKTRARSAVANALRDRRLTRLACEICANPKSEAHHEDYSKPLEVRWLCKRHHELHHAGLLTPTIQPLPWWEEYPEAAAALDNLPPFN